MSSTGPNEGRPLPKGEVKTVLNRFMVHDLSDVSCTVTFPIGEGGKLGA